MVGEVRKADVMSRRQWFCRVSRVLRSDGGAFSKMWDEYSMRGLMADV